MIERSKWCWLIPLTIALLLGATVTSAQEETGSLYGTVMDLGGESLPGVAVSLRGLGAERVQISDKLGKFRFLGLDPGDWSLRANLDGFSTVDFPNIDIRIGRNTTVEVQLAQAVEEVIMVTSESPLLDERKIAQGSILTQIDLETIPTARDPWAVLNQAPGVLVDRINVGGNESGKQSLFTAPGVLWSENDYLIDGVQITDMAAVGSSSTYYDFDQFAQMEISTGGSEITKPTAGVSINMITKRGTNELRGSARYILTDSDGYFGVLEQSEPKIDPSDLAPGQESEEIVGNQTDSVGDVGFEAGGPAMRDRVWLWGSWAQNDIQAVTADGQDDDTLLEHVAIKLNAQITIANSFVGSWNNSDKQRWGVLAGPRRATEAALDQRGPSALTKLEDTHVFGSSLVLSGTWSKQDAGASFIARGGVGPDAPESLLDSDGVFKQNWASYTTTRPNKEGKLDGAYFFGAGPSSHELKFGARFREFDVRSAYIFPGRQLWHIAGENWGVEPGPKDFLMAQRSAPTPVSQSYTSVWLQDTLTMGVWTVNAGLRYDLQEGENEPAYVTANPAFPEVLPAVDFPGNDAGGFEWETISPRVGVTYALGEERKTLLRASFSRFAEALGVGDIVRVSPIYAAYAYFVFFDGNDNNMWDSVEVDGEPIFLFPWGFDPEDPASLESPNVNDPSLDPDITDEVVLGVEHAFVPEFVVGLNLTWRNISHVQEDRDFIREPDGTVRLATREDYFLERTLEGTLPDGSPYAADFYALYPGLSYTGGDYRTNGDREREYLGGALTVTKRLSNQWMLRGFVNYGKTEWDVPESFFEFDDPTDDRVPGDNDGELFFDWGKFGEVFLQSTWSFNVNGMYQVAPLRPWSFNVAGNLYGREGYPLPYYVRFVSPTDGRARWATAVDRSDDFRTQDIYTLDLRIEKEFAATGNVGLTFSIDAFNVFNENYVLRRSLRLNSPRPDYLNETLSPRIFRLGVRLSWR